jgi:CHAT domain-containing protein
VEALVKTKHHLLVAPSGSLTALPFHLLVTEKPAFMAPTAGGSITTADMATYRDAAWLIRRHAVTVLPSATSLRALRVLVAKDHAATSETTVKHAPLADYRIV